MLSTITYLDYGTVRLLLPFLDHSFTHDHLNVAGSAARTITMFFVNYLLLSMLLHACMTIAEPVYSTLGHPELVAQTGAVCADEFSWMQNHLDQSPCLVVAFVLGACNSDRTLSDRASY
jgi:hypothetical protein